VIHIRWGKRYKKKIPNPLVDILPHTGDFSASGEPKPLTVKILHLSDTHSLHQQIENQFPMPPADILLHTGDFSQNGEVDEIKSFNSWLGKLKGRYPYIYVIIGNHDRYGKLTTQNITDLLSNAKLLDNEEITVLGLRIHGISWAPDLDDHGKPDHHVESKIIYDKIQQNVDILMTHGPADQIFDKIAEHKHWGSSLHLRRAIELKRPKVHLHGHLHEQRGLFIKSTTAPEYIGGVEYTYWPYPNLFPPPEYPCQLISCNAMKNMKYLDRKEPHIAGPARLIVATKKDNEDWFFSSQL